MNKEAVARPEARFPALLVYLLVFASVFIIYTSQHLPETVATHFGPDQQANGWMSRMGYIIFMLAFTVGMAMLITVFTGAFPAKYPQWTNLPNRDHWLAPQRMPESFSYLAAHGRRLAYLIVMMMLGMHYTILLANQMQPPRLPGPVFTSVLISFALALIWWIVRLYRRFPKPSK